MTTSRPDLSVLRRAQARRVEGWRRYFAEPDDTLLRGVLVQPFVFAYEIAHQALRYYLAFVGLQADEIDWMSFQDLIRSAR